MTLVSLGEIVDIKGGGTPDKSIASYWGGPIPWASVKDFKTTEISRTVDTITEEGVANSATNIIPANSILVPTRMAVGKAAINTVAMAINQDLKALSPMDHVDHRYLLHALLAKAPDLERQATGATVKGITLEVLRSLSLPLPPLDEQKRIAAVLDQADELRRKRQRAIDRLNQLGQAIFHEMFGDPVAPSNRLASRLIDIAELINGDRSSNYPSGDDIKDTGILFLNTTNIRDGELDFTKAQFITEAKFRSLSRGKLQRGDLVITLRGTLGQCALFDCQYETGFINAQMMIIRAKETVLPRFLREYISFPSLQAKLKRANSGSAVPQLTATQMKELQVLVPGLEDQRRFVEAIDAARSVQNEVSAHSNWLHGLFASLQHRAFREEL